MKMTPSNEQSASPFTILEVIPLSSLPDPPRGRTPLEHEAPHLDKEAYIYTVHGVDYLARVRSLHMAGTHYLVVEVIS